MATVTNNTIPQITVKSSEEVTNDILRTIRNGLVQFGVSNATIANVTPESDFGIGAKAVANEVTVGTNNTVVISNQVMPDTATGVDLDRFASNYGLTRRSASPAAGSVVVSSIATTSSLVPVGTQLVSTSGLRYEVQVGGVYTNGDIISVISLDTGSQVNLPAGVILTWRTPPPFFDQTAAIHDPITGGVNAEDDETFRARLLYLLANPPGAGNPSQLISLALASDPIVQSAFICPAARGPATVDICVVGYATDVSKDRNVSETLIQNIISPYVIGNIPQFADGYVCTVSNYPIDISIGLSLPDPVTANPAGPGGGFLDLNPIAVTAAKPAIRVVNGYALSGNNPAIPQNTATAFWIDVPAGTASLISGTIYNISYLSPYTWTLYSAQTSGIYNTFATYGVGGHTTLAYIVISGPFYSAGAAAPVAGDWIFPTAFNTETYINNVLDFFAGMGPGERVDPGSQSQLLPRAYRLPRENQSWPYKLNNRILRPIENNQEVNDARILFRGSSGTTDTDPFTDYATIDLNYAPPIAYTTNGTALGKSYIFVPRMIGIYNDIQ